MSKLMSTREVSKFLNVNEKMVYTLVSEKGLPASKITGKWLFPQHLVEQWVETHTLNFPKQTSDAAAYKGLLVVAGSNDLLLDRLISIFNTLDSQHLAVFGNLGSMGGLRALRRGLCQIAGSHLLQEDENEYNFAYASSELEDMPAMVNFCRREQGLIVPRGTPRRSRRSRTSDGPACASSTASWGPGPACCWTASWPRPGSRASGSTATPTKCSGIWTSGWKSWPAGRTSARGSGRLRPCSTWGSSRCDGSAST